MPTPQRWEITGFQGTQVVLYDLVKGALGADVTIASLSALKAKVFALSTMEQVGSEISLVIADCVFDTVQTNAEDGGYPTDGDGFNFRCTISGTFFPDGDSKYLIVVYFSDVGTPVVVTPVEWVLTTIGVPGLGWK